MRKHLYQCFEKRKMGMFPVAQKRRPKKSRVKSIQQVPVFCSCRMPEIGECMIECTNCKQWYHVSCVNACTTVLNCSASWFCKSCLQFVCFWFVCFFVCLFLTIVSLQYHFKLSAIYQHISAEFFESSTTSGVQILRSILTRESKYFEVVGLHGGPTTLEGSNYFSTTLKYLDRGGTISGGSIFFRDSYMPHPVGYDLIMLLPKAMTPFV